MCQTGAHHFSFSNNISLLICPKAPPANKQGLSHLRPRLY